MFSINVTNLCYIIENQQVIFEASDAPAWHTCMPQHGDSMLCYICPALLCHAVPCSAALCCAVLWCSCHLNLNLSSCLGMWQGKGWFRVGSGVTYHQSSVTGKEGPPQYTLTFSLTLPHDGDVVHLAHCYPYSYTHLIRCFSLSLI